VRCEQRRPSHLLTKPNFTPQFTHPFTGELEQRFGRWRRGRRRCPRALPAARLQEPWRGVPGRRLTRPGARLHHRAQQGAWVASARWSGADSARAEGSTPLAPPTTRGRPPPHVALSHRTWPSFGACLIEERLQRLVWRRDGNPRGRIANASQLAAFGVTWQVRANKLSANGLYGVRG
jgi:hypothetical protein